MDEECSDQLASCFSTVAHNHQPNTLSALLVGEGRRRGFAAAVWALSPPPSLMTSETYVMARGTASQEEWRLKVEAARWGKRQRPGEKRKRALQQR